MIRKNSDTKRKMMLQKAQIQRDTVEAIRECHRNKMKTGEIAEKFGVSGSVVANIIHYRTYCYDD